MKIRTIIFIISLIAIVGCGETVNQTDKEILAIENEIRQLETADAKKKYLEKILEDDQNVRDGEKSAELMMKYGKDSKEHMEYVKAQWRQDEINLTKVEKYLEVYGYPEKTLGGEATTTPWMVIHHSNNPGVRERNFEKVYAAYLKGDIDDGAISFYLGRLYQMKNGKRLEMKSPYRGEDEINKLIEELGLEEKRANAEKSVQGS